MRKTLTGALLVLGLIGCGGSLKGNGPDGSTTVPCSALGACECLAASDRCAASSEPCWCPSECYPGAAVDCICGGGRFLSCQDNAAASCAAQLAAVQTKCAGQPFVQDIADLCTVPATQMAAASPTCIAGCLANLNSTGSCSEIDCSFCPVCDCAGPASPSPFSACLASCRQPTPPPNI